MMKAYRITIRSWTSSFRYPNIISGYQPTLLVPPISTVLGLMNACAGKYIHHQELSMGYYFEFGGKAVDLETIYQVEINDKGIPKNQMKANVVNREFLFDCRLCIYLIDAQLVELFRKPVFPILLGRSCDLATIDSIESVELEKIDNATKIKGQVVPCIGNYLPGQIQALPKYFTDTLPRNSIGVEGYSILPFDTADCETRIVAYRDTIDDKEIDIFFHELRF